MFLIFDTETTGLPKSYKAPVSDSDNWPRMVQLAWQLHSTDGKLVCHKNYIIKPEGYTIPYNSEKVHGISTERAMRDGHDLSFVLNEFNLDLNRATYNVGHNIEFDINIVGAEYFRKSIPTKIEELKALDTKNIATDFCALPGGRGGKFKWPTLTELHTKLFGVGFDDAHDAAYDVDATAKCFFGLINKNVVKVPEVADGSSLKYEAPKLKAANFEDTTQQADTDLPQEEVDISELEDIPFTHLHCHSQFSILQSTTDVKSLVQLAIKNNMKAVALTDFENLFGAFHFVKEAIAQNIKPILGCELYLTDDRLNKDFQNNGHHQVLIAKNKKGYHNLAKLTSIAFTEGKYYVPRIDKEVLLKYKSDLIVTTGGLFSVIPSLILNVGEDQAETEFLWWKENFGDDFYVELNRHGLEEERVVNETLLRFCEKHDVKYFAANNTFYSAKKDANAHDILLCVKDAEQQSKPKKYIGKRGREFRFGLPNDEFYFKSPTEMKQLFADLPESIETTQEITNKIEVYKLASDVLLPKFDIPKEFTDPQDLEDGGVRGENAYLRHLTYVGAEKRYPEITDEIRARLDFELDTIKMTGYPGYFLIVQDFTTEARKMGVSVGPGRGSAAGSAVAYCVGITNVDPIKYDLLFERFLNPDRVSLPDIDIDFDDRGRDKIIQWVVNKYGQNQVAQIITYGTMAAKSAIRDTARVLDLPLSDADRIAKLVPDIKLAKLFGLDEKELKAKLNDAEKMQMANELIQLSKGSDLTANTINQARILEGSVRNTGIHACGVIITPVDITNLVPVTLAKDSDLFVTQFDNSVVEDAGLLKMDFLGLKTLTLIKDACELIKEKHKVDIDPDEIPLDDEKTYELFQRGETVGIFQYESAGMQKYLKELKPTVFADLIAMNALYRPGPIKYIPDFIERKHGRQEITYDIEESKEYLEETYGITVYQEQVMRLSQSLAGFTKGEADGLRKAMGKKIFALLEKLKPKFIEGGKERGHDAAALEKIWSDWEEFAAYAFNKSHSTCYALIAYHTAYLKAHYPAEYMAAVLSNNMRDIKQVTFFMEECKRMKLPVLGPDVNESKYRFTVNAKGEVRFGMGAIKGVGEGAVDAIVSERKENGNYKSIFDLTSRIDLKAANKRTLENLAYGGGFDSFEGNHRAQYFAIDDSGRTTIEMAMKYGAALQHSQNSNQQSLFGGDDNSESIPEPLLPQSEEWGDIRALNFEKEVVGIYISGHPLDQYKIEMDYYCTHTLADLKDMNRFKGKTLNVGGQITSVQHRTTKTGNPFGMFTIEDYVESHQIFLFGKDYLENRNFLVNDIFVFLKIAIGPKQWDKTGNDLEAKVKNIMLLSDVREKQTKKVELSLQLQSLSETTVEDLIAMLEKNKGVCSVRINVNDTEENIRVELPSKSIKVGLTTQFIEELNTFESLEFKVC